MSFALLKINFAKKEVFQMKSIFKILIIVSLALAAHVCYGQGQRPGVGNPGGGNVIPIDGGASLLAAAGIGYGVKKLYDSRKEKKTPD